MGNEIKAVTYSEPTDGLLLVVKDNEGAGVVLRSQTTRE